MHFPLLFLITPIQAANLLLLLQSHPHHSTLLPYFPNNATKTITTDELYQTPQKYGQYILVTGAYVYLLPSHLLSSPIDEKANGRNIESQQRQYMNCHTHQTTLF